MKIGDKGNLAVGVLGIVAFLTGMLSTMWCLFDWMFFSGDAATIAPWLAIWFVGHLIGESIFTE